MSDKEMEEFKIEQEAATEALTLMMRKGDTITWPEARPFYTQRFNGWMKDGEPHDLIKMLDRMQAQLEVASDHYAPKANDESYTRGWNEAMDYATEVNGPKMTEAVAVEVAAKDIATDVHRGGRWQEYIPHAKAALRAAGVKFREDV